MFICRLYFVTWLHDYIKIEFKKKKKNCVVDNFIVNNSDLWVVWDQCFSRMLHQALIIA